MGHRLFQQVRRQGLALGLLTALGLASAGAWAQAYPSRPITIIEPFATGGAVDAGVRAVADKLTQILGQAVVIDAKPGAGTRLGTELIRKARPDGYTIGMMVSASGVNIPALDPRAGYDPVKDFSLLTIGFESNFLIVTNPGTGIRTLEQLVAAGKAQPGKLTYGSSGIGTSSHLWVEIFESVTGASFTHVPYKGEAASMQDVGGGHIQFVFTSPNTAKPLIEAGKIVPLAYASAQRSALYPQVPTVDEAGWKNFVAGGWVAFIAPAGLPAEVRQKLVTALQEALRTPEVREKITSMGFSVVASGPEVFAQRLKSEFESLRAVGQARKIVIND